MLSPVAVELERFKEHLGVTGNAQDGELLSTLRAATKAAEAKGRVGPIIQRSFTSRVEGRGGRLILPKRPVASVTTVTGARGAGSYAADELDVDSRAGLVGFASGGNLPRGEYDVTYVAGWFVTVADVDDDVVTAVCIIGKHLWETQRGRMARPGVLGHTGSLQDSDKVPAGFALPHRAAQLLTDYRQGM